MRRMTIAALTAACCLGLTFLVEPLNAQGMQGQPQTPDNSLSVDFKGGSVSQFIQALKQTGKAVNVVASERAAKQVLSPVSLSQVSVGVAVFSIQAASASGQGFWRIEAISPPGNMHPALNWGGEAYSVDYLPAGKGEILVESYSLQRIIKPEGKGEGVDARVALTAIETGLKLQNQGTEAPPELQFHADSGLLFVRGTSYDVRLVGSIIARMSDDAQGRSKAADKRAREEALRKIAVKEAMLEVQVREIELQAAEKGLSQVRPMVEKGHVPPADLTRAELEVARARFNFERSKLDLERAEIPRLESTEPTPPPADPAVAQPATVNTPARRPATK